MYKPRKHRIPIIEKKKIESGKTFSVKTYLLNTKKITYVSWITKIVMIMYLKSINNL